MEHHTVPAAGGIAVRVAAGQRFRIVTPHGRQAADFFAFRADDVGEWLAPMHTWVANRSIKPRAGDSFLSRHRRPIVDFVEDGADGVHDMLLSACDTERYARLGHVGEHASCAENCKAAMRAMGHEIDVVPQPVNFFTNTFVDADGTLTSPPNPVPPGAYVELEACADLICVVSSCPYDLTVNEWQVNAPSGPTELVIELL